MVDARGYIDAMLRFGARLAPPDNRAGDRKAYLTTLVAFERQLSQVSPSASEPALKTFRREIMPHVQHLLWRLAGATQEQRLRLAPATRRALDVLDVHPDLLGPLEQSRAETTHTRVLAFLLNPVLTQLGEACRDAFVRLLLQPVGVEADQPLPSALDLTGATITAERSLGGKGRVDLSLDAPNALVFVEVKIDAEERPGQLADYGAALEARAGTRPRLLVFLTRDRDQQPRTPDAQRHVTFEDLLAAWLPVAAAGRTPEHEYLARYLKTLAVHLYGLAHHGGFERWPLDRQRRMLAFLTTEGATP